ncbi:multi-sensor hybrid histidine kinase [Thauera phenylacetica B4P]|uniref:Sensory/regulatory protein RpfC n=1 Tax=Thauera phenylacetica B4P TaxID=1234382 RepID=N6YNV3_9RHOO|nr:ATP-binding protein [Thauera phenylacetica]ENO95956.1 multi-sensor hybrid histidine kinase [Thauera phenylacetica B4P]
MKLASAADAADRGRRHAGWRLAFPLIALTVLVAGVGAFGYRSLSEEIRRETQRTLAVIAEQKRQHIEGWLAEARVDAQMVFSGHSQLEALFEGWVDGGRRDEVALARMQALVEELVRLRGWQGVALLDADGAPALAVGSPDLSAHAGLIADVLRRPRVEFVDLHEDARGRTHYGVLAPVGVPARGVAYLTWEAEAALYPMVEAWPVPTRSAETYLVRRDGEGVRFLTPLRHQADAGLALERPLSTPDLPAARAALGERGILSGGRDYRGVPVLAYAAAVEGTPWLMLAEIDEREAYSGIRTLTWGMGVVMALGLMLVYSAGYLVWRRDREQRERAALQARQAAEARFRVIFEQAPLGVVLLDPRTRRITEANPRFAEIVGRSVGELVGADPMVLTHPDDVTESLRQLGRLDARRIDGYRLNKRYLRPDGTPVWVSLAFAPVQVASEDAPRYLGIVEDISARIEMEERLRHASAAAAAANAAKSEFLAHMSHEIRTPMNAVLGLAQVLEREPLAPAQRDMVGRIRGAGQSLLAILDDVLDLSKIEAGQLRIEPRPFDLRALLANLDSLMGQAARAKGLALRIEPPTLPPGLLRGDGLRIEQILINLVSNAIKFTERGEVALRVRVEELEAARLRVHAEVRDTGIGIAPEVQARLFAPFTQADAGIARRFGGTGLGLSICKRLVELMGGAIGVHSEAGLGSTFWFDLPLERVADGASAGAEGGREWCPEGGGERGSVAFAAGHAARVPEHAAGSRLAGMQVLVVDDSAMNRDLVQRALALEGAEATLAADGQQAIELLRSRPQAFDAVLMDVQMPVLDGLSATRRIRDELGLAALPVIAFTAGVGADQQAAARAAGADDVLAKPMDLEQMTQLLMRWVEPHPAVGLAAADPAAGAGALPAAVVAAAPRPAFAPEPALPVQAAAAASATVGDAFPALPGIDRERAMQRLGKDRDMFLGLLGLFIEDNAGVVAATRADLTCGERDAAGRRMHTLRSNAGFICALAIMEAAGGLEKAIAQDEPGVAARLDALEADIAGLVEAGRALL